MKRFLLLVATICWPAVAAAEYPDLSKSAPLKRDGSHDTAVIVAVEDYLLLPDVPGALRNANDWEAFFRDGLGMSRVQVIVNDGASREGILAAAQAAAAESEAEGRLWFVFVGHGATRESGSDGVLVGMDARGTAVSLDARSVAQKELLGVLGRGHQKKTVMVLDACFSGRSSSGAALAPGVQPVVAVPPMKAADTVVFSAAHADQVAGSLPHESRPAFSYLLLGALRGWADTPGPNGKVDRTITAKEANLFVTRQLRVVPGRTQVPELTGDGELGLVRDATEPMPDLRRAMFPTLEKRPYLTNEDVDDAIGEQRGKIDACAKRAGFKGKVGVKVFVRPDGTVAGAGVRHKPTEELAHCILAELKKLSFPATAMTKDVPYYVPLIFE